MFILCLSFVLRDTGMMSMEYKFTSSQLLTVRALNVGLLLFSSNIPNLRPKMGLQLLVVVGSWSVNAGSRIQSEQDKWSKDLFMV